jgi:hypothetical protein
VRASTAPVTGATVSPHVSRAGDTSRAAKKSAPNDPS